MELTVGQFASAVDTTVRTLRYYEKIGLLVPGKKNGANQKIYAGDDLKKFYNIQLLKSMGWPLIEIKQMLEETAYSFGEMVEMQEAVLRDKRNRINESLEMIARMKNVMNETGDLNNEDLMLLMNAIRLEEDQRTILQQYFSATTVDKIIPKNKQQQPAFDRLNRRLLSFFQTSMDSGLRPDSQEVQRELQEVLALVPVSVNELFQTERSLDKQSEILKALLPDDMGGFFGEAIHAFYNNQFEGRGG
ncbi:MULTISPECIES: MerR family transcriptional regulator [unclassified Paenibacillus]|uniref:MerR family transcriptional regulator n=1 Tax=unclassified Paenibacillus TaxID=185978 RepID=UPI0030F79C44